MPTLGDPEASLEGWARGYCSLPEPCSSQGVLPHWYLLVFLTYGHFFEIPRLTWFGVRLVWIVVWIRLDWIKLSWIRLDWFKICWIEMNWTRLD